MQTIVELPEFKKRASSLLKEDEKTSIINYLAAHPQSGDLMQGTGGIGSYGGRHKDEVKVVVFG